MSEKRGRKERIIDEKLFSDVCVMLNNREITIIEAVTKTGIPRRTFYRRLHARGIYKPKTYNRKN